MLFAGTVNVIATTYQINYAAVKLKWLLVLNLTWIWDVVDKLPVEFI